MKRITIFIFLLMLFAPPGVNAQEEVTLSTLEVDLWPEYDRTALLVIYHATIPPEVSLPVELTFRIPVEAGDPNAIAVRQVDGSLYSVAYERQLSGKWGLVTFTATSPQIQLEYYDPSLEKQGDQRHFEYEWPGDYAVQDLVIQVQQPVGATDMRFSPSMSRTFTAQDGMVYYSTEVGSLAAGDTFSIAMDYSKTDETLSVEQFEVQPSAPLPPDTSGRVDLMKYLPWALGILGALLIVGGVIWYSQQSKSELPAPQRRRRRSASASSMKTSAEEEGVYCHNCGKRAGANDIFCRSCGTRLRTE